MYIFVRYFGISPLNKKVQNCTEINLSNVSGVLQEAGKDAQ